MLSAFEFSRVKQNMKLKMKHFLLFLFSFVPVFTLSAAPQVLNVEQDGIVGHYYQQPANSHKQPVIVLGGSEGGIPTKLAKVIAENGHPTLAVAYFKADTLPKELEKIPLAYFEKATAWLQQKHPAQKHITLVGWSKGAELALLIASRDTVFDRVIAIAPSSVVWAGILADWQTVPGSSWSQNEKELPFVAFNPTGPVEGLLDLYSQSLENRNDGGSATIPVENIRGNVVLYSGGMDEIWPSSSMAVSICQRMTENQLSRCKRFNYPELDHLLNYKMLAPSEDLYKHFIRSVDGK